MHENRKTVPRARRRAMSFKNAFKNLISHFGTVWSVLLYFVICSAIITGLSLPFILPIVDAFDDAGVFAQVSSAFSALFNDNGWNGLWTGLYEAYYKIVAVFTENSRIVSLTMAFLIFVVVVAFRFFFGLYDIPLATVLDGRLSCNADYGFGGKFFSTLSVSVRYTLMKMPITILFDAITFGAVYGVGVLMGINVALPFAVIFIFVVFSSFKSAVLACWAPSVAGGMGVVKGFLRSAEICFKRFGSVYSSYFVTMLLMFAFGMFVAIFTLCVGLIVAVPFFTTTFAYLNITVYYNKTGRRYYIDNTVYTPPVENTL